MPFQATFLFTTLIISLHSSCSATENMPIIKGGRPNIVLFLADDQSYFDHAINGNQAVPTPVTEAFSKEALVLTAPTQGRQSAHLAVVFCILDSTRSVTDAS